MNVPNRRVARPKLPADLAREIGLEPEPEEPEISPAPSPRAPSRVLGALYTASGVALVLGLSIVAALGARRYVTTTPRFSIQQIDVTGNARRTPDDVASEAGIVKGENVFTLDLDKARSRLLADPWIREATLSRRLPGTVSVQVTERDAAAIIALGDSFLASRDGDVFKRLESGDPTDLPVVTGLTADGIGADREAATKSIRRALDLAAEYERAPMAARAPLEEVHIESGEALTLFVGKNAVALELGAAPFHRKLEEAAKVLAELDKRGAKADAIMLDNEAHPERVVARVR